MPREKYKNITLPTLEWMSYASSFEIKELQKNMDLIMDSIKTLVDTDDLVDDHFEDNLIKTVVDDSEWVRHNTKFTDNLYYSWGNIVTPPATINAVDFTSINCHVDTNFVKFLVQTGDETGTVLCTQVSPVAAGSGETGDITFLFKDSKGNILDLPVSTYFISYQTFKDEACTQRTSNSYNTALNLSSYVQARVKFLNSWSNNGSIIEMKLIYATVAGWKLDRTTAYNSYIEAKSIAGWTERRPTFGLISDIYALEGAELNIYFDSILMNRELYKPDVESDTTGVQYADFWRITPDATDLGDNNIDLEIYDQWGQFIQRKILNLKVAAAGSRNGDTDRILLVGDSVTWFGNISAELDVLQTADAGYSLLIEGSQGTGNRKHEGQPGWTAKQFVENGSPFWYGGAGGGLDFSQYVTDYMTGIPDYVFIHLGINNSVVAALLRKEYDYDTAMANMSTLVNHLLSEGVPKIALCIPIMPAATQDAFSIYGDNQNRALYRIHHQEYQDRLIETFGSTNNVDMVPINLNLDTMNNFPTDTVPFNSRNSNTTTIIDDPVHPGATTGQYQIADSKWYYLKNQ